MILTAEILSRTVGLPPDRANIFAPLLRQAMDRFAIVSAREQAAFVGRAVVECQSFHALRENMNYPHADRIASVFHSKFKGDATLAQSFVNQPEKLADFVYGGMYGNRPGTDDGFLFRAGGIYGLTFLDNYKSCGNALGIDLVAEPERIEDADVACLSGAWFWRFHNLGPLALAWDLKGICRVVNGPGYLGLGEQVTWSEKLLAELGGSQVR